MTVQALAAPAPAAPALARENCLRCGLCREACPAGALSLVRGRPEIAASCRRCYACWEICPAVPRPASPLPQPREAANGGRRAEVSYGH